MTLQGWRAMVFSLGKKLTHNCLSRLISGLLLQQIKSIRTLGAHTTVGVAPGDCQHGPYLLLSAQEPSHLAGAHYRLTAAPYHPFAIF